MAQAWNRTPQQAHGAGNMRSGHGRATGCRITSIAAVASRARAGARSSDIRLCSVAAVSGDRTAATKESNGIRAGVQGSGCVRSRIKRWRIRHSRTSGAGVTRSYYHLDTSSSLIFNSGLQLVDDCTPFRYRATPGVNRNIWRLGWVALGWRAVEWIRCQEPLHALDVPGRCTVALIHVAAPDPLRARGHADLVTRAVIAYRCAGGMTAVKEIVARLLRIVAARITDAVVNGIVPVEVVIGVDSVPTSIVRFKRVMRPAHAGIRAGNNNVLTCVPKRPDLWRVRITDSWFDRGWP